jgi:hypothetical protein
MSLMMVSSGVGRRAHRRQALALVAVEVGFEHELGHSDDAVHRRPDLVAHVRQEFALGPARRLGRSMVLVLARGVDRAPMMRCGLPLLEA